MSMPSVPLGRSGIRVSRLALGSWRTYERIGRDQGVQVMQAGRELAALARDIGRDPAQLAMAFTLLNPTVTTVLFGATRPEQVRENVGALAAADQFTTAEQDRLSAVGLPR